MRLGERAGLGATEEGGTFLAPTARLELQRGYGAGERSRTGIFGRRTRVDAG